jgi:putative FmdB family regulatory protein
MPVYTYRCENCGVRFDRQQSFHDKPLTTCPECRKKSLKKVFQPVGIVFKGSGFYASDHKSSSGGHSRKSKDEGSENTPKAEKTEKKEKPAKKEAAAE